MKDMDKGVMGERVRAFKKKGMSEKDAVMASMKRSKKAKKDMGPKVTESMSGQEDYPYSSRIDLDDEMMEKLGGHKLKHGQKVQMHAKGHVHSMSEDTGSDGKTRRRATVQMTHMRLK